MALAHEECSQLLKQGLIKPSKSEWACQAFYVEKRWGKRSLLLIILLSTSFLKMTSSLFQGWTLNWAF
ncbi:uncharacterized protein G2W53_009594 [Senna tora]|uniref:Uncharacterized protein n=1 Tax=Senna tora TaxID=362788 RepID=A0A835CA64_9FABA|nr:uncharacterized protein G2W53_009594 [Senna tora]